MGENRDESSASDGSSTAETTSGVDEYGPPLTRRQQYAVVVLAAIAALVVGTVLASAAYGVTSTATDDDPEGTVAVVTVQGPIVQPIGADLEDELSEIRANDSIDAVVLEMDTPGGAPAPTERMYMSIQRTSQEKPVLASVQEMSASAGYYMMLPAEDIYVLPTSIVGSVGLAATAPQPMPPIEGPSGPDKRGSNVIHDWAQQETLGDIFIETVMEQRGDRIELSREEVATAAVFTGVTAVDNGYADEIGSVEDAVADAANRAGLEEYTVDEREVGGVATVPIIAQTDHGMVAIHDENPSYADVEVLEYAMVYEPAIPHVDTLDRIVSPDVAELLEKMSERDADDTSNEGGEQP